jgi:hypothetical protein
LRAQGDPRRRSAGWHAMCQRWVPRRGAGAGWRCRPPGGAAANCTRTGLPRWPLAAPAPAPPACRSPVGCRSRPRQLWVARHQWPPPSLRKQGVPTPAPPGFWVARRTTAALRPSSVRASRAGYLKSLFLRRVIVACNRTGGPSPIFFRGRVPEMITRHDYTPRKACENTPQQPSGPCNRAVYSAWGGQFHRRSGTDVLPWSRGQAAAKRPSLRRHPAAPPAAQRPPTQQPNPHTGGYVFFTPLHASRPHVLAQYRTGRPRFGTAHKTAPSRTQNHRGIPTQPEHRPHRLHLKIQEFSSKKFLTFANIPTAPVFVPPGGGPA